MKKKIIVLVLVLMLVCIAIFSGCNMQFVDLNFKFTNAYVKIGEEWVDLEIKTWLTYEGEQIQLTLHDGTVFIVNSMNCILYNGELPIQGGNNDKS